MLWRDGEPGRWLDDANELEQVLWRQHGVVSREQALGHLSRGALDQYIDAGRWQHPHPAVYVAHNGPLTREQALWVAVLGVGSGAVLAGATAAERCGLRGFPDDRIHVLIPAGCRERGAPSGVVVHRSTLLPATDVCARARPPHTGNARSLVDAASWAATDALGGAHSLPEAEFVRLLRRARLPVPRLQVRRRDSGGGTRYLDGYYDRWRLHVEIDGGQHLDVRAYWADMRRQNALWVAGDRVLRFPSWAIRREPEAVIAQVRAALHAAGWRPKSRDLGRLCDL